MTLEQATKIYNKNTFKDKVNHTIINPDNYLE